MAHFIDWKTKTPICDAYFNDVGVPGEIGLYGYSTDLTLVLKSRDGSVASGTAKIDPRSSQGNFDRIVLKGAKDGDMIHLLRGAAPFSQPLPVHVVAAVVATGAHAACPAAAELKQVLASAIPYLAGTYTEGKSTLPRLQTPPEGDKLTRHTAGLALDIILFNSNPVEQALAHHLFKLFLEYKHHMNWLGLIYENVALNRHGNPLSYTQDNKHRTHIHIDWLIVEDVTWTDERNAEGKPVVAKTIPWPGEAHTTGFAERLRPPLTALNADMNTLVPIDLMKLSGLAGQKE